MESASKRKNNKNFEELDTKKTTAKKSNKDFEQKLSEAKSEKTNILENSNNEINNQEINYTTYKWIKKDSVIVCDFGTTPSNKILGFDMDQTLIDMKSENKFPINADDWIFLFNKNLMIEKMNEFLKNDYKIAIFTNQKGISIGKTKELDITTKIERIQKALGIPLIALIATDDDYYRKPSIGLWKLLFEEFNGEIKKPDLKKCLYIGDAAGRKVNQSGKKDWSNADYLFSKNINVDFKVPEAFFDKGKNSFGSIDFDPKVLKENENKFDLNKLLEKLPGKKDIIIFCGSPGSGKTNLYHNYLKKLGYEHVNQDQLKTEQKCVKVATEHLSQARNVAIDSTNPTKLKRKVFIDLAKKMGATIRCFFFKMEKNVVFHLNNLRSINKFRTNYTKGVADVIIHTWFKNLDEPKVNEGFDEVHEILFVPGPFENEQDEEIFYCYS